MAYTPPTGDALLFVFETAYTPPLGSAVDGDFAAVTGGPQYALPDGIDSLEMGGPAVTGQQVIRNVTVGLHDFYGVPSIGGPFPQTISDFTPLSQGFYGVPKVGPDRIAPDGIDSLAVGKPQDADHFIRYRFFDGIDSLVFGSTKIGTRQYVDLLGNTHTQFGTALLGYDVSYQMDGWDSSAFGLPDIDYHRLRPIGIDDLAFGLFTVKNARRFLNLADQGIPPAGIGNHDIRSSRAYVFPPSLTSVTDLAGGATEYGTGWTITGPDGPIAPLGLDFLRIGNTTLIYNKGVGVRPPSIPPPDFPASDISHRIRAVTPVGFDSWQGPSLMLQVRNAALAAYPSGFDALIGPVIESIKDARQTAVVLMPAMTEYGTAMIAYRIRTIVQLPNADPDRPSKPTIHLSSVPQDGIDSLRTGLPHIEIHFNRAIPFGIPPPEQNQQPLIKNRNRNLPIGGETHTQFGTAFVWKNKLEVAGLSTLEMGVSSIADRTGRIFPAAWDGLRADWFLVRHDPEPPLQQVIKPFTFTSFESDRQNISTGGLYPDGFNSMLFGGNPTVIYMGMFPKGWIDSDLDEAGFGTPVLIFTQTVFMDGLAPNEGIGIPELWPRYVTAPNPQFPVDEHLNPPKGPGFPSIDYFHRFVHPLTIPMENLQVATPSISLHDRVIRPTSIDQFRYGFPVMGGGVSTYEWARGVIQTEYGGPHTIGFPPPPYSPYVAPLGTEMTQFGSTDIMLKNRQVTFVGIAPPDFNTIFPPSGVYYTPLTYGPTQGFIGTVFGTGTFIAYRNRSFQMQGFDSFNAKSTVPFQSRITKNPPGTAPFHALR